MARKLALLVWLLSLFVLADAGAEIRPRPTAWAQPVPGAPDSEIPNFYKVSDALYRSARPTAAGMRRAKELGVRTVVNLRQSHHDAGELAGLDLQSVEIPMTAWNLDAADAASFLRVVADPARTPALVHCQRGADRTGAMVAVYRVAMQGWTKEQAFAELAEGGYGFNPIFAKRFKHWIDRLDVERLRRDADLPPATAPTGGTAAEP
jgi:protein tyrosine phosphatase (PTP) superfamily phosphohydrolase (DUF442 family)